MILPGYTESDYISNSFGPDGKPDGYVWHVTGDDDHLALGGHETALEPVLIGMADPDKAFINVGAHVGLWAVRLAKHVSRVYAIEANPKTARKLDNNVMLNDLYNNVIIYNMAAWNNDTDILSLVDEHDMATGGSTRAEVSTAGPYDKDEQGNYLDRSTVRAHRLDGFDFGPVGLISMDVEGAEAKVLEGAEGIIMKHRPNMEIELHCGHPGTDPDLRVQVYSWLDKFGYTYNSVEITGERLLCYPEENALAEIAPSGPSELTYTDDDVTLDLFEKILKG